MAREAHVRKRDAGKIGVSDFPDVALHKLHQGLYLAIEVEERFSLEDLDVYQQVRMELDRRGYAMVDNYPFMLTVMDARDGMVE
ncbi:MAG: hypothetical protein C4575_00565 [Desulforudis sp.]|jgi:hypothetical protein|nr:MAG: hypothetical protein C4575_00565 [Desulforudis sp.]